MLKISFILKICFVLNMFFILFFIFHQTSRSKIKTLEMQVISTTKDTVFKIHNAENIRLQLWFVTPKIGINFDWHTVF